MKYPWKILKKKQLEWVGLANSFSASLVYDGRCATYPIITMVFVRQRPFGTLIFGVHVTEMQKHWCCLESGAQWHNGLVNLISISKSHQNHYFGCLQDFTTIMFCNIQARVCHGRCFECKKSAVHYPITHNSGKCSMYSIVLLWRMPSSVERYGTLLYHRPEEYFKRSFRRHWYCNETVSFLIISTYLNTAWTNKTPWQSISKPCKY